MSEASIILPAFNESKYIARCINSIKNQTIEDFECIVIDDGSTDNTYTAIKEAVGSDKRFSVISQSHQGLSEARNAGIDASSSDIVYFVDADDFIRPQMIEKSIRFLNDNNLDIAFFDAEPINQGKRKYTFAADQNYFVRKTTYEICSGKAMLERMLANNDYVYAVFIQAIRKSAIKYRFYPGMRVQDELYTTQNLILADRVGHFNGNLYFKICRLDSVSSSQQDVRYAWSRMKAITELLSFSEREWLTQEDSNSLILPIVQRMSSQLAKTLRDIQLSEIDQLNELSFYDRTILKEAAKMAQKII